MDDSKFNKFIDQKHYNNLSLSQKVKIKKGNKRWEALVNEYLITMGDHTKNEYCNDLKKKPFVVLAPGDFVKWDYLS